MQQEYVQLEVARKNACNAHARTTEVKSGALCLLQPTTWGNNMRHTCFAFKLQVTCNLVVYYEKEKHGHMVKL